MYNELVGQKVAVDSRILSPHFTQEWPDARKGAVHPSIAAGGAAPKTDMVTSDGQLFLVSGGRNVADPYWRGLSKWARSGAKRGFDCICVLLSLPVVIPLLLAVAVAVRLTSRGPVLFLQERVGRVGRTFTILKFRTMVHLSGKSHQPVTTLDNQRFTLVGPFLRRWKLDELPQLMNVLMGHMSLVGPRPKMPEHVVYDLPCRPGVTGAATLAFADEASILNHIPNEHLEEYFRDVVLPAKRQMDAEYMASATFFSDLHLLIKTALRRWNPAAAEAFIAAAAFDMVNWSQRAKTPEPQSAARVMMPRPAMASQVKAVEQATAV